MRRNSPVQMVKDGARTALWLTFLLPAALPATSQVAAATCAVFDASFNLYVLGSSGGDYNLGPQSSWSGGSAKQLPSNGRPPYTGSNMQCYLAQFFNAIYVLNADAANPSDVYIFNAANSGSWSTQKTNANGIDLNSAVAILDHDTNVFFALSGNTLYQADFQQQTAAAGSAIDWQSVGNPGFSTDNYKPVMGLAQNHIHFLDVPSSSAGQAYIFVIHFAFFQPAVQAYPATGGGQTFPVQHGKTASFFDDNDVQKAFAFVPDDGSATYVINVETNTTQSFLGPTNKDPNASYGTSDGALVQLTSSGQLSYFSYNVGSTKGASSWQAINVSGATFGGSGGGSNSSSASPSATPTGAPSGSSQPTQTPSSSGFSSNSASGSASSGNPSQTPNSALRGGASAFNYSTLAGSIVTAAGAILLTMSFVF